MNFVVNHTLTHNKRRRSRRLRGHEGPTYILNDQLRRSLWGVSQQNHRRHAHVKCDIMSVGYEFSPKCFHKYFNS